MSDGAAQAAQKGYHTDSLSIDVLPLSQPTDEREMCIVEVFEQNEDEVAEQAADNHARGKEAMNAEEDKRPFEIFIHSFNSSKFLKSFRYSVITVSWLLYHSLILGFAPGLVASIIFGSTRLFEVNKKNVLYHYLFTDAFFIMNLYTTTSLIWLYIFGIKKVQRSIFLIGIPSCIAHIITYAISAVFLLPSLAIVYYGIFLASNSLIIRGVKMSATNPPISEEQASRYDILSSDGTPSALLVGYVPFLLFYYVSSNFILPLVMGFSLFAKMLGRILIFPFLFSLADTFQNNLLLHKSKKLAKYRALPGNMMNFITVSILRFMIADSPNFNETMQMSLSSAFFEVVFRVTFVPRSVFISKISKIIREIKFCNCCRNRKIENIEQGDVPPMRYYSGRDEDSMNRQPRSFKDHPSVESKDNGGHIEEKPGFARLKQLWSSFNQKDDIVDYVLAYRSNRINNVSMFELQMVVYFPIFMYLSKPIQDYVFFQTIPNINQMLFSILIQLVFEILAQVISITLENHFYDIEIPVVRAWDYNMKPPYLLQSTIICLTAVYLSISPFRPGPVYWSSDTSP